MVNSYACEGCGVCAYVCPVGAMGMKSAVGRTADAVSGQIMRVLTAQLKMGSGASGLLVTEVKKQM